MIDSSHRHVSKKPSPTIPAHDWTGPVTHLYLQFSKTEKQGQLVKLSTICCKKTGHAIADTCFILLYNTQRIVFQEEFQNAASHCHLNTPHGCFLVALVCAVSVQALMIGTLKMKVAKTGRETHSASANVPSMQR